MIEEKVNCTVWAGLNNPELQVAEADAVVLGLPFDGAASYRKGAALAPDRIRSISTHIPPTTETGKPLTRLKLRALGNLAAGFLPQEAYFAEVEETAAALFGRTCLFFIGGNHSVTIPLLKAAARVFQGPLGVIHLDARLDLCHELSGNRLSHGCTHRRALENPFIELQNLYFLDHADITSFVAQRALTGMWGHLFSP